MHIQDVNKINNIYILITKSGGTTGQPGQGLTLEKYVEFDLDDKFSLF